MQPRGARTLMLLMLLHGLEAPQAGAAASAQDGANTTVEHLRVLDPPGSNWSWGVGHEAEGVGKEGPSWMTVREGMRLTEPREKVRGLKTVLTALLFIGGYLLAHVLASPERGLSALSRVESLQEPENMWLASAAAVLGMFFSGLGELVQSVLLRRGQSVNLASEAHQQASRKRGLPQMVTAAFLYVSCLGAALYMGPLFSIDRLQAQILSTAAAGLFFWGAALYFDPFGLVD
ncbi:hypothetical protein, conserved [Eimeria acervulina]|uniref:Uncharacterized protein n=1 Tax=Eimeria acervulina TaxID=5801 RepID=U6GYF2_EIMAC|nr:hypothetical protein, conserved [Eimeria acervulina]CDI83534.1 hypothetical protein, conserved [Eimeria acervulina]